VTGITVICYKIIDLYIVSFATVAKPSDQTSMCNKNKTKNLQWQPRIHVPPHFERNEKEPSGYKNP